MICLKSVEAKGIEMENSSHMEISLKELRTGIDLTKCQQCGCMDETLEQIGKSLPGLPEESTTEFRNGLPGWVEKMKSIRYS